MRSVIVGGPWHLPGASNVASFLVRKNISIQVIAIISKLSYLLLGSEELRMIAANYLYL